MIKIIDYGLGNVKAFQNLCKELNVSAVLAKNCEELNDATKLIMPGVGSFDGAMNALANTGMIPKIEKMVLQRGVPIMGVCVGMQMFGNRSDEGVSEGLGWIPGDVRKIKSNEKTLLKLPKVHMGWNTLEFKDDWNNVFCKQNENFELYFLHSFYFDCADNSDIVATTNFGIDFPSIIKRNNIFGVQGHPEKSHWYGKKVLQIFLETL